MALIVTPGSLARQSEFYHQLSAMIAAGTTLVQALEQLQRTPPSPSFRSPIRCILDGLAQGLSFTESLLPLDRWLPSFDHALLAAGEKGGRLDVTFRILAEYYRERAQLARRVLSDLAYPVFLIHFAIVFAAIPGFFVGGDLRGFLKQILFPLAPLYLAGFAFLYAIQGRRGSLWRACFELLLHRVPVLGTARRSLAIARLTTALDALLNAGVAVAEAWTLAAQASGSPALGRAVRPWPNRMLAGDPPGDLLQSTPEFPEMFRNLYRTGELSGTLDDTLKRLRTYYQDDALRKMRALAEWIPRLIYIAILLIIAHSILSFWLGYYGGILDTPD